MIWFVGDLHGIFGPLIDSIGHMRRTCWEPSAIVLLGDVCAPRPLNEMFGRTGFRPIYFIHGNHDTDSQLDWANLMSWEPERRWLHARTVDIAGVDIAGLGGVFRKEVWMPGVEGGMKIDSYRDFEAQVLKGRSHADLSGKEHERLLRARSTIFPRDCVKLLCVGKSSPRCDVLVTHEAPEAHCHGNAQIDRIAKMMRAKLVVHGHHHQDLDYPEYRYCDTRLIGVGGRGIVALDERSGMIYRLRKGD